MQIIIPTKGRTGNQLTYKNLPLELQRMVTIVCPEKEVFWLKQNCTKVDSVIAQPDPDMGIAEKRKWIVDTSASNGKTRIVMLDDDLRFAVRRTDNRTLFRKAEKEDILKAFAELENILDPFTPHAGFSARGSGIGEAAQRGGWQEGKRMMYVLGYYLPIVRQKAIFGRIGTHEDMDICLQLLEQGYPNAVNYDFVVDQKFGNEGGCSRERTVEKNNADALKLAELHPGYVRVTQKDYASSTPRIEVVCQWAKALKNGLLLRKQRESTL